MAGIPLDETNAVIDVIALRSLLDYLAELMDRSALMVDHKNQESVDTANSLGAIIPLARDYAKKVEKAVLDAV